MRRAVRILGGVAFLAALAGCGDGSKSSPPAAGDVYHARGVVERLPQADGPDKALYIHHEPIPGYRDETGAVVGMGSMTMPFPLARGVATAGLAPGDSVAFTFVVTWKPRSGYEITEISKLPAGTADGGATKADDDDAH